MQNISLLGKCTATRPCVPTLLCASESPTELLEIEEKWVLITKSRAP